MEGLLEQIRKKCEVSSCSELCLNIKGLENPHNSNELKLNRILTAVENLPEDAYSQEEWDSVYRYIMGDNGGELSGRDRLIARLKYEERLRKSEEKNRKKVRTKLKKISEGGKRLWENVKQLSVKRKVGLVLLILLAIICIRKAILNIYSAIDELSKNESWINAFMLLILIFNFAPGYSIVNKVCVKAKEIQQRKIIDIGKTEYISFFEVAAYIIEKMASYIIMIALCLVLDKTGTNKRSEIFVYKEFLLSTVSIQLAILWLLWIFKGNALIVFKFNSRRKSLKLERERRNMNRLGREEQERRERLRL